MTIAEFIVAHPIILVSSPIPSRPDKADFGKGAFHYVVTLTHDGRSLTTYYSKGAAHVGRQLPGGQWKMVALTEYNRMSDNARFNVKPIPPQLPEVLESLASDCRCVDDAPTWEEFAGEFGYDVDSIRERETFLACQKIRSDIRKLLAPRVYAEFVAVETD